MTMEQYRRERAEIGKYLRSEGGKRLLSLLERQWNPSMLIGKDPQETAYNVGLRDAYTFLNTLSKEGMNDG